MNRRYFIKSGSIALASFGVMVSAPSFLKRALAAAVDDKGKRKTLIAIFQRGAVDGLNVVVPYGEHAYYDLRPNIIVSMRSEEHTSELQSQSKLVCRLLLEKKKKKQDYD